jgi:membrane carboxypeptidase/penicillin-binding protein PbpC
MVMILGRFLSKIARIRYVKEWHDLQREVRHVILALENVPESDFPPSILQAMLVTGEDHRFYSHFGIDLIAVCRAIWRTVICGRREGASTIEMQLVWLTNQREDLFLKASLNQKAIL